MKVIGSNILPVWRDAELVKLCPPSPLLHPTFILTAVKLVQSDKIQLEMCFATTSK